jgi:glutamate racemase
VFSKACPLFVPLVEEGWTEHKATEMIALEYLFPLMTKKIDTLVLGCTHYPLLKKVIANVTRGTVQLIDSGEATAGAVKDMLMEQRLFNPSVEHPNVQFFVSDAPDKFTHIGERFLGRSLGVVKKVSVGK